jgi:diguanylate cyclase (GGDEF)-like protein
MFIVVAVLIVAVLFQRAEALRWKRIACTDPLTGLPNRYAAQEELRRRKREPVAVVFVDLDNFKALNDAQGHTAGDEALRKAAQMMREVLRPEDKVFRYGGDEFVIVTQKASFKLAEQVAERIERVLPYVGLSASTGIGLALGDATMAVDLADRQMYMAKRTKNQLCLDPFDPVA